MVHIFPSNPPKQYPETYYNRKGFHSLNAQLTVNADMYVTNIYTGWPGSVHDSKVFNNSDFLKYLQNVPDQFVFFGDAAYPCQRNLIVPFKGPNLTNEQKRFNYCHSATRMVVERAIGLLKGRFRRLMYYVDMRNIKDIIECILAACVIHNIALMNDVFQDIQELIEDGLHAEGENDDRVNDAPRGNVCVQGQARREQMVIECNNLN